MKNPLIAIVGRPNVGKSTLFNRLIGFRKAIVYDRPGVTRDRNIAKITLGEQAVDLMDTGGFEFDSKDVINKLVNEQILKGIENAAVILLVFDGKQGITAGDERMVNKLRTFGKKIVVAVNKMDTKISSSVSQEFYKYGFKELIPVSSEHGMGFDELRSALLQAIGGEEKKNQEEKSEKQDTIRIAFVGRPNVGKSSIINAMIDEERVAVSEIAGTTRDMIDIAFEKNGQKFILLDTAGMRYKRKVEDDVEYFSIKRTFEAIDQADIVFLVVAADDKLTTQDQKIASKVIDRQKGLCLLVNKWDLMERGDKTKEKFRKDLYDFASFLKFADVSFISAKTKLGIDGILKTAKSTKNKMEREYTQEELMKAYKAISNYHHEVGNAGFHLQLKGLFAIPGRNKGPIFRIKCNKPHRVSDTYQRYWENALTDFFQLRNVPLKVIFAKEAKKPHQPQTKNASK